MNKSVKIIMILICVTAATFATGNVYAQSGGDVTVVQNVEYIVVISAIIGSLVSVYDGYNKSPEGTTFNKKKLMSAFITAITTSMFLISFNTLPDQVNGMSMVAICVSFFLLGYGGDKGLARLDK